MKPGDNRLPDPRAGPTPDETDTHDLAEVESRLRAMSLAAPSARLEARVRRVLARPRPGERLRGACLAAAAIIAVVIGISPLLVHRTTVVSHPAPRVVVGHGSPAVARPLRVERDALRVADNGVVAYAGNVPVRGYRCQAVRQIWYFDARQGRRLCVTIPTDQLVLVPVRPF